MGEIEKEMLVIHLRPADSVGDKGLVHVFLGRRHCAGASLALSGGQNRFSQKKTSLR